MFRLGSCCFSFLLCIAAFSQALDHPKADSRLIKGEGFRVELHSRIFRANGRQVKFIESPGNPVGSNGVMIDGKEAAGVWMIPSDLIKRHKTADKCLSRLVTEFDRFDVWIGSKKVSVPKKYYSHLLRPHLGSTTAKFLKGGLLEVRLMGADGAAGWIASWTISNSGKVLPGPIAGPP